MIDDPRHTPRLPVLTATAVALIALSSGGVVLAGNIASTSSAPAGAAASAPGAATSSPTAGDSNPFAAAVQVLLDAGTIDQDQADALNRQIDAGSIDPEALVSSGVLTTAQMQLVQDRLVAVKESLATAPGRTTAAAHTAFDAVVQTLVDDGTIDRQQADVLRPQIDAGWIDPQQLVSSGVLTAAEMQAVQSRLAAVKESFAPAFDSSATPASKTSKAAQETPSSTK